MVKELVRNFKDERAEFDLLISELILYPLGIAIIERLYLEHLIVLSGIKLKDLMDEPKGIIDQLTYENFVKKGDLE